MIVWMSGPTGSGKSSLAQVFRSLGYLIVEERLPEERFLAFTSDPVRHCEMLQEEIMRSRFEQWQALSKARRICFDRSIDEDVHIFCRMHRELNFLNQQQYERLQDVAHKLQSEMPMPDLIVFMCAGKRVLEERVKQQAYPVVIVQSLNRQVSLYTDWLATRREEVLRVDNSTCSQQTVRRLFSEDPLC